MNTVILTDVDYTSKQYFRLKTNSIYNKNISIKKQKIDKHSFNLIHLLPNSVVHIRNFNETEYELPSNPKVGDTVLFFVDPLLLENLLNINFDCFPKIKIYRNKKRIMGLEEHLLCDRPFQSLKLSFYTDEDGWIII